MGPMDVIFNREDTSFEPPPVWIVFAASDACRKVAAFSSELRFSPCIALFFGEKAALNSADELHLNNES